MGSEEKKAKKEKREARSPEDAAAREARKAAKRAKKEGEKKGGGGGGESGADGAVARVRVSPVPPGSDAATIAAFLGVDASKVVVLSGEATAIMLDAAAAANAASTLDETKFKGRFVRVVRDDFRPDAVAADASGDDEVRDRAARAKPPSRRPEITHDIHDDVVEVECAGQTGRIIGKGGSKIREIEELTGCVLRVRQEEGVCEVSGRDVNAAVQEIKNIVQDGRERDEGGGKTGGFENAFAGGTRDVRGAPPRFENAQNAVALPFGVPPPGSASRHDSGANDWTCVCGSVNFARRSACFRCHAPRARPSLGGGSGAPPAEASPAGAKPAAAAARAPTQGHDGDGYEVFVKYLPHETSELEVGAFFAENFGPLKGDVRLIRDQSGRCKGAGFVTFASEASRAECLRRDGARFGGRHISVSVAKTGTFGVRATEQKVGTHTPAMLRETLDALVRTDPRGVYVDGTFGRGGHSRGILGALAPEGRLHAFDMDPEASTRTVFGKLFSDAKRAFSGFGFGFWFPPRARLRSPPRAPSSAAPTR